NTQELPHETPKTSSPSGVRRRSRAFGGLTMIDASLGIAVPRSEPSLDALVLDGGVMGPALSSRPIIPANVPFACPCPRSQTSKVVRDMGPLMKPCAGT